MSENRRLGVLISGRGSNLQAIIDAIKDGRLKAMVAIVISNRADALGLDKARAAGIETVVLPQSAYSTREDYDQVLVQHLQERQVDLVCLAGFMRLLSQVFIDAFPNAVLNVHPSLLPAFPGLDAQRQAWEHGVRVSGATVHLVTVDLDAPDKGCFIKIKDQQGIKSRRCEQDFSIPATDLVTMFQKGIPPGTLDTKVPVIAEQFIRRGNVNVITIKGYTS